MVRLRLLAVPAFALAFTAACTDAAPYMQISDAPGDIAFERDPIRGWSTDGGTTTILAPGTATFPQTVTLRIEGRHADGGYDTNDPLRSASFELVPGSACRQTFGLVCMGGICFTELELSGPGLCVVHATGVTSEGVRVDDCWYRGTWEADPADTSFALQVQQAAEDAHASCLAISE